MIVKDAGEEALSIEDGVVPPASPAQQLFDDISITIEIIPEQKVLRLIRIDQCIRHNQLHELKGHV